MTEIEKHPKISRDHFSITTPEKQAQADREYWLSKTIEERLEYMEYLRRVNYGDAASGRLQRVFEVVERSSS